MKIDKQSYYFFLLGILSMAVVVLLLAVFIPAGKSTLAISSGSYPDYTVSAPKIPDEMSFAGERVPIENTEVRERMDKEFLTNVFWHSATFLALKRTTRWFPVIEPILKRYNVPDDFKYLCVTESNLDNGVSGVGATGFWQLMESTAKQYGLEVNDEVDERYSVEKSTEAACKYLLEAHSKLGNWTAAAASYNMGVQGIANQRAKQNVDNYYGLLLNHETYRFVCRIVSFKYIIQDPAAYGFKLSNDDMYKPYEYNEITVDTSISNFTSFSEKYGITYGILKLYNPWLRDNSLKNKQGRPYSIKIPKEGTIKVIR